MSEGNRTKQDVGAAIDHFDFYTLEGKWNVLTKVVQNLVYAIDVTDLKVMNVPEQRVQAQRLGISLRDYLRFIPVWETQSKRSFNEVMIAVLNLLLHPNNEQKARILTQVDSLNKFNFFLPKKGVRPELVVDSQKGGLKTTSLKTYFEGASRLARVALLTERFEELTEPQIVAMQTWKGWATLPEETKTKLTHKFAPERPHQIEMAVSPGSQVASGLALEGSSEGISVEGFKPVRSYDNQSLISNPREEVQSLMRNMEDLHSKEAFFRALTEFFPKNLQRQVESMGRRLTPHEALFIAQSLQRKSRESGFDFQGDKIKIHKESPLENYEEKDLEVFFGGFTLGSLCSMAFCAGSLIMNGSIEYTLAGGALIGAGVPGYALANIFKDRKNIIYVSPPVAAILTEVLPRTDLSSMSLANEDLRLFVNQLFSLNEFLVAGEYIHPLDSRERIYNPQALHLIEESVANHLKAQRDTQRLAELKKNNPPNPNKSKKSRGGTRISE